MAALGDGMNSTVHYCPRDGGFAPNCLQKPAQPLLFFNLTSLTMTSAIYNPTVVPIITVITAHAHNQKTID